MKRAWMGIILCIAALAVAELEASAAVTPGGIVIAVDTSGSVKPVFSRCLQAVQGLIRAAPDGSSICLLRFDETAAVVAQADDLSSGVRQTFLDRADALRPVGQRTDFAAAVRCIQSAAEAMSSPRLVVVLTDALSDPGPGVTVEGLDQLLLQAFPARDKGTTVYVVVPDAKALALVEPDPRLHAVVLADFSPAAVVRPVVPAVSVPVQSLTPRSPSRHWSLPHLPLQQLGYAAGLLLVLALLLRVRRWARRLRRKLKPANAAAPADGITLHVVVSHNDRKLDFGPLKNGRQLAIGAAPGCDFRVMSANGAQSKVLLQRGRREQFTLHNRGHAAVTINGLDLPPRKSTAVRLPAKIDLGGNQVVRVALVPVTENPSERKNAS